MTSRLAVNSLQWMCANIAAASSKGGATKRRGGSSNIWSGSSKKPNSSPSTEQPSAQLHPVVHPETSSNNAIQPNDAIESTPNSSNVINKSSNSSISNKTSPVPIKTFSDSPKSENHPLLKLSKARELSKRDMAANFKRDTQSIHRPTTHSISVRHSTPPQLMRGAYRGRGRRARGGRIESSQTSPAISLSAGSTDDGSSVRRSSRLASRPKCNFANQNPVSADHSSRGARRSPRTQLASPSSSGVEDTNDLASSPSISTSQQVVKATISNVDTNEPPGSSTSSPNDSQVSAGQSFSPTEADELKSSRRVAPPAEVLYSTSPPSTSPSIQESAAAPSSTSLSQTSFSSQQPSYTRISASASQKSAQSTCLTSLAPSSSKSRPSQSVPEPKFALIKSHSALPKSVSSSTSNASSPKRSLTTRSASGIARYNPRHWQLGESGQDAGRDVDEEVEENAEASAEDAMRSSSFDFDSDEEDDEDDDEDDDDEEVDGSRHASAATQSHSLSQPASSKRTAEAGGPRLQVKFLSSARILDRLLQYLE